METNKKFGYALGGMYTHYMIHKALFDVKEELPNCFYDDFYIDAIFGNFQFCIWDGGRIFESYTHACLEDIEEIRKYYNETLKVPIRFIYTNTKIEEKHLYDRFSNYVTELCENDMNEIVVNSPYLEEYLRNKYPKYKFVSSTTKCVLDPEKTKELLDNPNYSVVCLDFNQNYKLDFLKSLSDAQKEKCEFLVNAICGAGCQNRKRHYDLNSLCSLTYGKRYSLSFCNISSFGNLYPPEYKNRNNITYQMIKDTYAPLGFKHFKIEGRTFHNITYLCSCINYMVKPEYHTFILDYVHERYLKMTKDKEIFQTLNN